MKLAIDVQVPVHNNIWSNLWFRTAILSSPFYNIIVPMFLRTGDDMTVPSSSILSEQLQHMQVTIGCCPHAQFITTCMPWSQAHSSASIHPPHAAQLTMLPFKNSFKSDDACWYLFSYKDPAFSNVQYMIYKYQLIIRLPMVILTIVVCFQHSKWVPINADWCVTSRGYPGPLFSISLYNYQAKGNWIVGQHCLFCKLVAELAGHLCEFHTKEW